MRGLLITTFGMVDVIGEQIEPYLQVVPST
jgi:hypothetical protein